MWGAVGRQREPRLCRAVGHGSCLVLLAGGRLSQQSDNVPLEQSGNVPLTTSRLEGCRKDYY